MVQEQLSKSTLLVIAGYKWQTALSAYLMTAGYNPTKARDLKSAYLCALTQDFDLYVVGGNSTIIPEAAINISSPLDFHDIVRNRYRNAHTIIVSQGSDSILEEKCNEKGIKFMDFGTDTLPNLEGVMELINYLKRL